MNGPQRPGKGLATRPLYFYWIADCSASMAFDGKIEALNKAVRDALPQMVSVAGSNPHASIYVRTLRFAGDARWIQSEPIALDRFAWDDLQVEEVPRTAEFAAEFRSRLAREGAQGGDIQIALIWHNHNDLDLHVTTPSNEKIYFGHRKSECGGELDVDMNVSPTSDTPVENVYWPPGGAPTGTYKVEVNHFRNHGRPGCQDPTRYEVAISVGGVIQHHLGSISSGATNLVTEFTNEGAHAGGGGGNTSLGEALDLLAESLDLSQMPSRALPPVFVLMTDGQPTDDFERGLGLLMAQPWGKRGVRIGIAIGQDADTEVLRRFVDNPSVPVLQADNPDQLTRYIRWASTEVLKAASAPASQTPGTNATGNVPVPTPQPAEEAEGVW